MSSPAPALALPPGSCDCHAHVLGPYARFPLAAQRAYSPPEAPLESYLRMLAGSGLARGVLVHPSAYGLDCSALRAALRANPERLRGVAVIDATVSDEDLDQMHGEGVRAARFTETSSTAGQRFPGSVGLDQLPLLAPRLRRRGWHAQLWAPASRLAAELPALLRLELPLVIDHLGSPATRRGPLDPAFQALRVALRSGQVWIKLTVQRASSDFPHYADVRALFDALLAERTDRLLWGSDWPFLNMAECTPTVPQLLGTFFSWVSDAATRQAILADNPRALFGFGPPIIEASAS